MRIDFISLFPEMIESALNHSITGRALKSGQVISRFANPRDFAHNPHKTVDDKPFGGGPGMLMMAEPIHKALQSLGPDDQTAIVMPDPTGVRFSQEIALSLAQFKHVVLVCGHYEGIDERFAQAHVTHRLSIGDYILTGGELPALIIADALIRLQPGVLGDAESLGIDSHSDGLLSSPQFTRPAEWNGLPVPEAYLSGDHRTLKSLKRKLALQITRERRPDLFALAPLEKSDIPLLKSQEDVLES